MPDILVEGAMKPLEEIYGPKFFARRDRLKWRCEIICNAVNAIFEPESVGDVGCGIGDYVYYWKNNLNVPSWGIEGSEAARPYFVTDSVYVCDLRTEIVRLQADLVTCFEVFEHIEIEYSDILIRNLTRMSNRLLISAAPPGAGGHHHVNCQPQEYWIRKMWLNDYEYDYMLTVLIKEELKPWRHRKELYHNNLMYFKRRHRNELPRV